MISKVSKAFRLRDTHREDLSLVVAVVTSAKGRPVSGVGDTVPQRCMTGVSIMVMPHSLPSSLAVTAILDGTPHQSLKRSVHTPVGPHSC